MGGLGNEKGTKKEVERCQTQADLSNPFESIRRKDKSSPSPHLCELERWEQYVRVLKRDLGLSSQWHPIIQSDKSQQRKAMSQLGPWMCRESRRNILFCEEVVVTCDAPLPSFPSFFLMFCLSCPPLSPPPTKYFLLWHSHSQDLRKLLLYTITCHSGQHIFYPLYTKSTCYH